MTRTAYLVVAALAACTINGKGFGLSQPSGTLATAGAGASHPTASGAGQPTTAGDARVTAAVAPPPSTCRTPRSRHVEDQPPFLDRPADPWLAVKDGAPVALEMPEKILTTRGEGAPICDAAHDHCLRDCAWFDGHAVALGNSSVMLYDGGADRIWISSGSREEVEHADLVAYRTVPATRRNLELGALVVARDAGQRLPEHEGDAMIGWHIGEVASIDWAAGTVRLAGPAHHDPYFISGARVAVLVYRAGHAVEVMPGADPTTPTVAEVILPAVRASGIEDPWAQVDAAGQPRAVADRTPLVRAEVDCAAKFNHCLRPWAWLLETGTGMRAVHWSGSAWVDPRDFPVSADQRKAYRTRVASRADLRPGRSVIVFGPGYGSPASEAAAYEDGVWFAGEIEAIDDEGAVRLRDDPRRYLADNVRVPVLWWFPGERAAKVE